MTNDARVSVIIPAYQVEISLGQCLESVFAQSHPPFQVIVINDGSRDGTERVAQSYGGRVIYVKQENAGQGAARNAGLKLATGEYITFLDADDYWNPEFLKYCVLFLKEHPETIAVSTGWIVRMHDGAEHVRPEMLTRPDAPAEPFVIEDFYAFWAEHDHVRTGTALIRKSVIDQAGRQRADLRVSQDLEYWGHLATFGKWGFVPEPLWIGNSRASAAADWLTKNRMRRKLCPKVEAWQERLLPRLTESQLPGFRVVRGRVAAGYAQNHILGGDPEQARHIVNRYGGDMPDNRLTRVLRLGMRGGRSGWAAACAIIRCREYWKAWKLSVSRR